jgi:hypothetical protein
MFGTYSVFTRSSTRKIISIIIYHVDWDVKTYYGCTDTNTIIQLESRTESYLLSFWGGEAGNKKGNIVKITFSDLFIDSLYTRWHTYSIIYGISIHRKALTSKKINNLWPKQSVVAPPHNKLLLKGKVLKPQIPGISIFAIEKSFQNYHCTQCSLLHEQTKKVATQKWVKHNPIICHFQFYSDNEI